MLVSEVLFQHAVDVTTTGTGVDCDQIHNSLSVMFSVNTNNGLSACPMGLEDLSCWQGKNVLITIINISNIKKLQIAITNI